MKILLITDEVWNDEIHGNNILTNWFDGFDAEFANVYCSPGMPKNSCCKKYFQLTDKMMVKSIFTSKKAGKSFNLDKIEKKIHVEAEDKKLYTFLKKIATEPLRLTREIIWSLGNYNLEGLENFINDFEPDIIFSPRYATLKLLRIEKKVFHLSKVPMVAFTGDDEYSMKQFKISPFFWIQRFFLRKALKRNMLFYSLYYVHSENQMKEYIDEFGIKIKKIFKTGNFLSTNIKSEINDPIKIVYAGRLYCNRWKILSKIGKVLKEINKNEIKIKLNIYTKDKLSKNQLASLDDNRNIFLCNPVSATEVKKIYKNTDITLHVESFDLKNYLLTRHSFSTKIIDCMESGSLILGIGPKEQTGIKYLSDNDIGMVCTSKNEIKNSLDRIIKNKELIVEYSDKVIKFGKLNHERKKIQNLIKKDFNEVINEKGISL